MMRRAMAGDWVAEFCGRLVKTIEMTKEEFEASKYGTDCLLDPAEYPAHSAN